MKPAWHGTANGYQYHRCRCFDCRQSHLDRMRRTRAERHARTAANGGIAPYDPHGTLGTYSNWGCRCEPCTAANARNSAANRARARARRNQERTSA